MDWLLRFADKAFDVPPREALDRYLGAWDACYLGHAAQDQVRACAASGGMVSALLIYLLQQGIIEGALVSQVEARDGGIQASPYIARTREEILQGQGSIYMEFPWMRQVYPLLKAAEGSLAVVGLPCQIQALRHREAHDPQLAHKVKAHIALVCGRSSSKRLLLNVLARKGIRESDVTGIRFREGPWRGRMHLWLRDGSEVTFPFEDFSLYRNLHFYCEKRCLRCQDLLGEHADIVCGDAWLHELKERPVKHSLVISRMPQATEWIEEMAGDGSLVMYSVPPETVFRAQRRGLIPAKRGKQAKARLSRLFGYRMPYQGSWCSHWNDYLVAAMILLNYRWAAAPRLNSLIFKVPKPFFKFQLAMLSLLKNF